MANLFEGVQRTEYLLVTLLCLLFGGTLWAAEAPPCAVTHLRCECRENPLGIDTPRPRFSWWLQDARRGGKQTAYQVVVAAGAETLAGDRGDMWDSGKVASSQSAYVTYDGASLLSAARYWWKVRVWDAFGAASPWSAAATWTMGLLAPEDWGAAQWIGPRAGRPAGMGEGGELGYHAAVADGPDVIKWVQVDLRKSVNIDEVRLHPLEHAGVKGFGFPIRFSIGVAEEPAFAAGRMLADHTAADVSNPGRTVQAFPGRGVAGRYVRVTAVKLWQRPAGDRKFCFGLAELEVFAGGKNLAAKAPIQFKDSEEGWGWGACGLTDGKGLVPGAASPEKPDFEDTPEDPGFAAILMRRELEIDRPVRRATAFLCGLGWSELYVDGSKVSDAVISPAFSSYTRSVNYVTHDLTAQLKPGRHALGVLLGNGWLNTPTVGHQGVHTRKAWSAYPKLLLAVQVEYADGATARFVSDEHWKWATGEITHNDGWCGEDVDRRRARPGWSKAGCDEARWRPVTTVPAPGGRLMAQQVPPIRVCETILPASVQGQDGTYTFTLPNVSSGWPRLKTRGPPGHAVTILWGGNKGTFTLNGAGDEVYEPSFIYETVHQVTVKGLTHAPEPDTLVGQAVHTQLPRAGDFSCSNPDINRLMDAARRTQENYVYDFPQDPTREKTGWTQDVENMLETAVYLHDAAGTYRNWFKDFREAQRADGYVPSCAPGEIDYDGLGLNGPWWGGMMVWGPWHHYLYYGDRAVLAENYPAMKRLVDYLTKRSDAEGVVKWGLGDWMCPGRKTPVPMTSTAAYAFYARIISETARILGKAEDIAPYAELAEKVKGGLNRKWLNAETGVYETGYQTMQSLCWSLDLAPRNLRDRVLQWVLDDIAARKDHLDTGFVGTLYLQKMLMDAGRSDILYKLAAQKTSPSWNTCMRQGVFMEDWGGGKVQMPSCGGNVGLFFFQGLAGIVPDSASPGFKKMAIRPAVVGELTWVKAHYDSAYGRIVVNWNRDGDRLMLDVTVPANTEATIVVPTGEPGAVTESGQPVAKSEGLRVTGQQPGQLVLAAGAGSYHFASVLSK